MAMIGERRALLLILTVFCIGTAAPAAANAEVRFTAPEGTVIEAEQAGPDIFSAGGIEKECDEVEFQGALRDNSRTLELVPRYDGCVAKALNGLPAKYVVWNCAYVLHPSGGADKDGTWRAAVDVECPSPYSIEWNVYENEERYEGGDPLCITTMPAQRAGGMAELSNTKGSHGGIAVRWRLHDIKYEAFGSTLFCGSPPGLSKSDSSYTGRAIIGATDPQGHPLDLELRS